MLHLDAIGIMAYSVVWACDPKECEINIWLLYNLCLRLSKLFTIKVVSFILISLLSYIKVVQSHQNCYVSEGDRKIYDLGTTICHRRPLTLVINFLYCLCHLYLTVCFNTLGTEQNGWNFADNIFKCIKCIFSYCFLVWFRLNWGVFQWD